MMTHVVGLLGTIIFRTLFIYLGWNFGVSPAFALSKITVVTSFCLYLFVLAIMGNWKTSNESNELKD